MSEHIREWLGAYLDGELRGASLRRVEQHLAHCQQCQAELDEMRGLSTLLQDTPPAGDFLPTERFVANLTLNLPRQTMTSPTRKAVEIGWWSIPFAVAGTWIFMQMTFRLSSLVMAASDLGLLGDSLTTLAGAGRRQTIWFGILADFIGNPFGLLGFLNDFNLFIGDLTVNLIWQALLGGIYLAWLAYWWLGRQKRMANPGNFSRS